MAPKNTRNIDFKEILMAKINDYMDQAFATEDLTRRQKLREAISELQKLLLLVSKLEQA